MQPRASISSSAHRSERGFIAWEWLLIIACIIPILYFTLKHFTRARIPRQPVYCINNLRQIEGAKEQWALETKRARGAAAIENEIDHYIKGGHPKCPQGGTYTYGNVGQPPRCSFTNHFIPLPP